MRRRAPRPVGRPPTLHKRTIEEVETDTNKKREQTRLRVAALRQRRKEESQHHSTSISIFVPLPSPSPPDTLTALLTEGTIPVEAVVIILESILKVYKKSKWVVGDVEENVARSAQNDSSMLLRHVCDLTIKASYRRVVSPKLDVIREWDSSKLHSAYGEILPGFIDDITAQTGLKKGQLFLDAGAGVGNVVLRVAVLTGANTVGIELDPVRAQIANTFTSLALSVLDTLGVEHGQVSIVNADMTHSDQHLSFQTADVVFCNNAKFGDTPTLIQFQNSTLPQLLKDQSTLVTLVPLPLPSQRQLRHGDPRGGYSKIQRRKIKKKWVSWKMASSKDEYGLYCMSHALRDSYQSG
ncbi:hypothetical protein JCM5350_002401 [Sporobolomyces pararoseus]